LVRRIIYRLKKGDRGASIIEFAILLPLLLTLVIGIIEFGWILTGYITITGAAREGARVAVVDGDYVQAVYNHTESMPALEVDPPSLSESSFGEKMTVTVTGSLSTLVGFFDFLGDTYNFTATASMRQEFKND
jgi:Flp pilus assembly protein TadG